MSNSRSSGRAGGRNGGSGSRGGAIGHVEVIPFRPSHSWWVQALLMVLRWLPELLLIAVVFWVVAKLHHLTGIPALVVLGVLIAVLLSPLAWGPSRRWVLAGVFLSVTRHRLRVWFLNAGIYNRSGRLPWIFWIIPTPVGERVWILLVPGLSVDSFTNNTEAIAAACWARTARIERARANGAIVRLDIIRHDPLTGASLPSVLVPAARVSDENTTPITIPGEPTALDLPARSIPGADDAETRPAATAGKPRRSARDNGTATAATELAPDARDHNHLGDLDGEDLSDYV